MNTQSVLKKDRAGFEERLLGLMFDDGFGFDEALDPKHVAAYAEIVFGNTSPTACLRVRRALDGMRRENIRLR